LKSPLRVVLSVEILGIYKDILFKLFEIFILSKLRLSFWKEEFPFIMPGPFVLIVKVLLFVFVVFVMLRYLLYDFY
jgi:hypothetical protein